MGLKPENKATLVDILTFHVLPAKGLSTDLTAFQSVETVEGKKLDVTVFGGVVKVGASLKASDLRTVTAADNLASNGVEPGSMQTRSPLILRTRMMWPNTGVGNATWTSRADCCCPVAVHGFGPDYPCAD